MFDSAKRSCLKNGNDGCGPGHGAANHEAGGVDHSLDRIQRSVRGVSIMKKKRPRGWLLLIVLVAFAMITLIPWGAAAARDQKRSAVTVWSATSPAINETHLFAGYINRKGDPVGFHSRPGGHDPGNARVTSIVDPPNKAGIYTARVQVRASGGRWLSKQSTFFPDSMTRKSVVQAVLHAYQHRTSKSSAKFSGPSGSGFTIEGYLLPDGRINTAFPVYRHEH
jgi:hypothetical protein